MARRRRHSHALAGMPLMPFLSIMLGLMSVMALTTLGISAEQRQEQRDQTLVELVAVPEELVPVYLRCGPESVSWLNDQGQWGRADRLSLFSIFHSGGDVEDMLPPARQLVRFLRSKTEENRSLSFSGRQHSLLLWVEPQGVETAQLLQLAVGGMRLPIRIGQLPIQPDQEVVTDASP